MDQQVDQPMNAEQINRYYYTVRYGLLGAAFGLLFPLLATTLLIRETGSMLSLGEIIELHLNSPLLLIIDTAPIILGIFAASAGWREDRLQESNQRLAKLVSSLEERVTDRARDLDRTVQVSHSVTQVEDLNQMLAQAVELIRSSFDFYFVQVYLLDVTNSNLVLRAGSGALGNVLVNQRKQFPLNLGSIIGTAAIEKQTIIVADIARSQITQPDPLLPEAISEMAMPLLIGERVIGVLDIQSDEPGRLSSESLPALEAVSGQLAVTIENARLVADATEARADIEQQARRVAHEGWEDFLNAIDRSEYIGYVYEQDSIRSLSDPLPESPRGNSLAIPIVVTGQPVGTIQVHGTENRAWSKNETELVAAVAEQVGRQVEGLRLLAEADHYRIEAEEATRRLTREGWEDYLDAHGYPVSGFEYDNVKVGRLSGEPNGSEVENVVLSHDLSVRGETIGQLQIDQPPDADEATAELVAAVAEQLSTHLENLRLAERTERVLADTETQANRLAILNELSQALASAATLDEVYRVTAVKTPNIVPAERISLAILGDDSKYFEILALREDKGATKVGDVFSGDGTVLAMAVQQNRVVVVNRAAEAGMPGIESFMVAPLTAGGRTFGTFNAGSTKANAFDSRDESLLLQIASLLASTLETRRLFTETVQRAEELAVISRMARARADELTILNEMGQALTFLSDEKSIINIIQHHTAQLMPAEGLHVALYDGVHDEITITIFADGQEIAESGLRRRLGNGITEFVLNTREPLLIKDHVNEFVEEHSIESEGQFAKSWLGVPMLAGDRAIGILAVQSFSQEDVYDEHDRDLLTAVANQAAIALENARLFAQVEERARRERILREITARVKSSADVDSVLRTAAQEVGRALGRQTFVYLGDNKKKESDEREEDKGNGEAD